MMGRAGMARESWAGRELRAGLDAKEQRAGQSRERDGVGRRWGAGKGLNEAEPGSEAKRGEEDGRADG